MGVALVHWDIFVHERANDLPVVTKNSFSDEFQ